MARSSASSPATPTGRTSRRQLPSANHQDASGWRSPPPRACSRPTSCHSVGWSLNALPPLVLLVGLVQLAYCDLTRRLLPKTLVHALSAAVIASGLLVAAVKGEWHHLLVTSLCALAFFVVFFVINLMNPRWMAFGDVRLSLVVGFGLAWVSPIALLQGFLVANLLAAVVGLVLIAAHKAERRSAVPFGLYLALGAALVLVASS